MSAESYSVRFHPVDRKVRVRAGTTVWDAAAKADIFLDAPCGGRGLCGKCRVRFSEDAPAPADQEKKLLSSADLKRGVRLACTARVMKDSFVEILPESAGVFPQILSFESDEVREAPALFDPPVSKVALADAAEIVRESKTSDTEVLREIAGTGITDEEPTLDFLKSLPEVLRGADASRAAAVISDGRFLGVTNVDRELYGIALDVGTTTVAGALMNLGSAEQVAVASRLNAQSALGADIMSRINFSASVTEGLKELNHLIIGTVNGIVEELCAESDVSPDDIWEATVVGNTTMVHLFLGVSPQHLGHMPYTPVFRNPPQVDAGQLGLNVNRHANVHVLPCIGGFVGADSVGVLLSRDMRRSDRIEMAVDIGTNGEILLGSSKRLLASSTAAGPALEGAEISCGIRAVAGAIERVEVENGDLAFKVIGNREPVGVCGSGLVDLVAILVQHGVVARGGRLLAPEEMSEQVRDRFGKRIVRKPQGNEFVIYCDSGRELRLTQGDVRKIQLAKGAIRAGIEMLKNELGVANEEIYEVYIAGAFGNYISKASAVAIGLLPPFPQERIKPVGNAAGAGAKLALLSRQAREEASEIAKKAEHVELGGRPAFQDAFAEAIGFPGS